MPEGVETPRAGGRCFRAGLLTRAVQGSADEHSS